MKLKFCMRDIFFDQATFLIGGIQYKIRCFKLAEEAEFNQAIKSYLGNAATDRKAFYRLMCSCVERYPRKWYQRRRPSMRFMGKYLSLKSKMVLFQAIIEVNLGLDSEDFFEWLGEKNPKKFKDRFPVYAFFVVEGLKWTPEEFKMATLAQMRLLQEGAQDMAAKRDMEAMHNKAKHG